MPTPLPVIPGMPAQFAGLQLPTGEELYNFLMKDIDTDLLTDQLALLDEKYKNETPEQAAERAKRYEKSFAEYETRLAAYMGELNAKVHEYQHAAMKSAEHEERVEETNALGNLEKQIGAA
jgi:hypothetical protein